MSPKRADRDAEHEPAVAFEPVPPGLRAEKQRVVLRVEAEARGDHRGGRERDDEERDQEGADELRLVRRDCSWRAKKSTAAPMKLAPNETFGTSRFSGCSISRYSAVLKPKLFAIRLPGKLWHALL